MKLKLFPKLFLAFLLTTAVLVLGMAWSAHWTFKQGLRDYLHSKEMEQFDKLIPAFEDLYIKYGGWELLRGNHFLFREAVHSALGPPKTPPFDAPPHPPPPGHRRGGGYTSTSWASRGYTSPTT
ncbi:secreted protein [Beggiatoa sp. PS]|nr:secreted protein [Beggiatoa sp. PS]